MKILLVATFGKDGVSSYDHYTFYLPLKHLFEDVIKFDFVEVMHDQGRQGMNQTLLNILKIEQPTMAFFVPHTDQFIPEVIDEINKHAMTVCYFFDDMWRVDYSRFWANHFQYVTTSDINGLNKFRDAGFSNVIYSPFACNTEFFIKKSLPKCYNVSFVGGWSPYRDWYLQKIRKAGIDVRSWGTGWKEGSVSYSSMVDIFNQSRINLNLSNSASWDVRYLMTFKRPIRNTVRAWRSCLSALYRPDMKTREQVKGRHFEINSCGVFQLSYYVEGLESHYQIGKEIALYESIDEIIDKIRYYLKHDEEREAIAKLGYARTRSDHTMEKRFQHIFRQLGLL